MWTYHPLLPLLDDFLTCQFVHVWCYITLIKNSVDLFIEFTGILLPILCSSPLGCCSWISLGHISLCPRSIWLDCVCLLIKTKNDSDCSVFCVSLAEEILHWGCVCNDFAKGFEAIHLYVNFTTSWTCWCECASHQARGTSNSFWASFILCAQSSQCCKAIDSLASCCYLVGELFEPGKPCG